MSNKKFFRIVSVSCLVLFLIGTAFTTSVAAKEIKWRMQSLFGPDPMTDLQTTEIIKVLNKRLEGKLHIKVFWPGQIVPMGEIFGAVSKGVVDLAYHSFNWDVGAIPAATVGQGLPFSWNNLDQMLEFYYDYGFLDYLRTLYAKKNIFLAAPLPYSPSQLMTTFPINTYEDMKGKKIWATGSYAKFVNALGGSATLFPPPEIYMGLKLGTIGGVIFGQPDLETMNLKEVVNYLSFPTAVSVVNMNWLISMDSWNDLPKDVQTIFEDTLKEISLKIYNEKLIQAAKNGLNAAEKIGVKSIKLGSADVSKMRKAAVSVWNEIAATNEDCDKAIQMLKEYLATKE